MTNPEKSLLITVEWQVPDDLELDPDLNDKYSELQGKTFYTDNLLVRVSSGSTTFTVARRFVITITNSDILIQPEIGWDWNEHGELEETELALFEQVKPEYLIPPKEFCLTLHSIFKTAVT